MKETNKQKTNPSNRIPLSGKFLIVGLLVAAGIFLAAKTLPVGQQSNPLSSSVETATPAESQLVAAELYTHTVKEGESKIFLKATFTCGTESVPAQQSVVIHEREAMMVFQELQLDIQSQNDVKGESTSSCLDTSCVRTVLYAAPIMLPVMPGGFDVVWMYSLEKEMAAGMLEIEERGLSLSVFIDDPMVTPPNQMASLGALPQGILCMGEELSMPLSFSDLDGDELEVLIKSPTSWKKTANNEYLPAEGQMEDTMGTVGGIPNAIRFGRPPFESLEKMDAFDPHLSQVESPQVFLEGETLTIQPTSVDYLFTGLEIVEKRAGVTVGSHDVIFLYRIN